MEKLLHIYVSGISYMVIVIVLYMHMTRHDSRPHSEGAYVFIRREYASRIKATV